MAILNAVLLADGRDFTEYSVTTDTPELPDGAYVLAVLHLADGNRACLIPSRWRMDRLELSGPEKWLFRGEWEWKAKVVWTESKTLRISIAGERGSGKTTVQLLIARHLKHLGFDVTLLDDGGPANHRIQGLLDGDYWPDLSQPLRVLIDEVQDSDR